MRNVCEVSRHWSAVKGCEVKGMAPTFVTFTLFQIVPEMLEMSCWDFLAALSLSAGLI